MGARPHGAPLDAWLRHCATFRAKLWHSWRLKHLSPLWERISYEEVLPDGFHSTTSDEEPAFRLGHLGQLSSLGHLSGLGQHSFHVYWTGAAFIVPQTRLALALTSAPMGVPTFLPKKKTVRYNAERR